LVKAFELGEGIGFFVGVAIGYVKNAALNSLEGVRFRLFFETSPVLPFPGGGGRAFEISGG